MEKTNLSYPFTLFFSPLKAEYQNLIKRGFDILVSALGILFLSPFILIIAIAIKRDSPGPVFYKGPRVGKNGKEFKILKFRTMYEKPESYHGARLTAQDDCRITPFGKWLRDTKINELPQLWNVLVGEMSFVGPRPEDPQLAAGWPPESRKRILSVRPGITSPASVIYRDEEKMLSSDNVMDLYLSRILPDKMRLDELYVKEQSICTDLDVIFMTIAGLTPKFRTASIDEFHLFAGYFYRIIQQTISWVLIDTVIALLSIGIAAIFWKVTGPFYVGIETILGLSLFAAIVFSQMNRIFGLRKVQWRYAGYAHIIELALCSILTMTFLILSNAILPQPVVRTRFIIDFSLIAFNGFVAVRYRRRLMTGIANHWLRKRRGKSKLGEKVLVVGAGDCGETALWLMQQSKFAKAFVISGFVDDDFRKKGLQHHGIPVIGLTKDIPHIVAEEDIKLILFAISDCNPKTRDRILNLCRATSARVIRIPDFIESFNQSLFKQTIEATG